MDSLEHNISRLPPDLKKEVADFVEFLLEKRVQPRDQHQDQKGYLKLGWRGALSDVKDEFDAVGLQHEALKWRGG